MKTLALLALALAGCYQRDIAACAVSCATSADCPSGLECTATGRCGESANACSDLPDNDAQPDMPQSGTIHVLVFDDRGLPTTGIRVIASAADGTALGEATTLADGTVDLEVTGDADITVVRTNALGSRLTTIRSVAVGETVKFGRRRNEIPSVSRTITWATEANVSTYVVTTSCRGASDDVAGVNGVTTQQITLMLDPTCANDFDVVVNYRRSDTLEDKLKFKANNTGNVTFDAAFTLNTVEQVNFSQLLADVATSAIRFTAKTIFRTADPAFGPGNFGPVAGGSGGATANLSLPTSGLAGREIYTVLGHDDDPFKQLLQIAERVPAAGQYNLNIEPLALPWMTSPPTVDLGARTIRWTEESAGPLARTSGDMIVGEISYTRGPGSFTWRIIAPPSAAQPTGSAGELQLAIPDLPGDEAFEPRATDTLAPGQVLRNYAFTATTGLPLSYASVSASADLAIDHGTDIFLAPFDTFLTVGLGPVDLSRMVVSVHKP